MVFLHAHIVDKYLTVILIFMLVGIPISLVNPTTGEFRFYMPLFYGSIGGAIAIVMYDVYKTRKQQQRLTRDKRKRPRK